MKKLYGFAVLTVLLLGGCAPKPVAPVPVAQTQTRIDYQRDVEPIFNKRCVVCHSCYNSPCQLKLSSFQGVARGATKALVYDATRLDAAPPTRLFIDAQTPQEWHDEHGFFSVTGNTAKGRFNNSTMISLLQAKNFVPMKAGAYSPEFDTLACPKNHRELSAYLDAHPERGMPYGFPPLSKKEFTIISQWLQQGAHGPTAAQQKALVTPSAAARPQIEKWERFLNTPDPKHAMTARYLYEHLFLAHIRFEGTKREFYTLVRSRTPSPEPIDIIPTRRPYDDPGKGKFYYRFRKVTSTIVFKTHMLFPLNAKTYDRIQKNFIDTPWTEKPHIMDYNPKTSADPFTTFRQIPASVRYNFLLDHSEYIVRTFIRGPVCKGQIALNVINDHFWVMFLDPKYDLSLHYPNLLNFNKTELLLPDQVGSNFPPIDTLSNRYINDAIKYYKNREAFYAMVYTKGLGYDAIWKGNKANDAPFLTVYRHFDSASVRKGALGELPKTMWVIDYPLFERIYYALVAGFDVYGNVGHQVNVRRYMDRLRVEGESYFIDFMPKKDRQKLFNYWNQDLSILVEDKLYYKPSRMPTAVVYKTHDPKREFVEHLVEKYYPKDENISFDPLNYFYAGQSYPPLPKTYKTRKDYIQAFRSISAPGTAFIRIADSVQANVAFVRVRRPDGKDLVFSFIINRWHNNVAFMFDETSELNPSKDTADFIFDYIGCYPNMLMDVNIDEAPLFFDMIKNFKDTPHYRKLFFHFAIDRSNPRFWKEFDWFQQRFYEMHPESAGLFDLNRYYKDALSDSYYDTVPGGPAGEASAAPGQ
jgi:hypothetical protein